MIWLIDCTYVKVSKCLINREFVALWLLIQYSVSLKFDLICYLKNRLSFCSFGVGTGTNMAVFYCLTRSVNSGQDLVCICIYTLILRSVFFYLVKFGYTVTTLWYILSCVWYIHTTQNRVGDIDSRNTNAFGCGYLHLESQLTGSSELGNTKFIVISRKFVCSGVQPNTLQHRKSS